MVVIAANSYGKKNPWRDVSPGCPNGCSNLFVVLWEEDEGVEWWRCVSCAVTFKGVQSD